MPKSKQRNKKAERSTSRKRPAGFFAVKHPFSDIPRESLREAYHEIAEQQQKRFPQLLEQVNALVRGNEPLQTIATLATYGLFGLQATSTGKHGAGGREFGQSHVELLQAIFLRQKPEALADTLPTPQAIQELFDRLPELGLCFMQRRLGQAPSPNAEEVKASVVQEWLRAHTQAVRNWGFFGHVVDTLKRICAPIDNLFLDCAGIKGTDFVRLFERLLRRSEDLVNQRWSALKPVMGATSIDEVFKVFMSLPPELYDSTLNAYMLSLHAEGAHLEEYKFMALAYLDLSLAKVYTLDTSELAAECEIPETSIISVFERLNLRFGELANHQEEHLFLNNPVWTHPIIKLPDGRYFCAIPQVALSFSFQVLSNLLNDSTAALKRYERRRAEFLESEILALFKEHFPRCEIAAGYRWREGDQEFENDLMIRVDSHLVLVEAKSHAISWPALRGATERAKRHVQDLLLAPSLQSFRLEERVREAIARRSDSDVLLPNFPVRLAPIRSVVRLSVTLEDFATLQTAIRQIKDTGWLPIDHQVAPCILLTDLKIVFDLLESTPYKLHYLKRRAEIAKDFYFRGDELDLLGLYLRTGFNLGTAEVDDGHFTLFGMSKAIDDYYQSKDEGGELPKPAPRMTKRWRDILSKLEERQVDQWADIACVLLSVSKEQQEEMQRCFKRVANNVRKHWEKEAHLNSITLIPVDHRQDAVAFFGFNNSNYADRHESAGHMASKVFDAPHVKRCLVVGINVDRDQYPYSFLEVFFKDDTTSF